MQTSRKRLIALSTDYPCPVQNAEIRFDRSMQDFPYNRKYHQNKKTPVIFYIGHNWDFFNPKARIDQKKHQMTINITIYRQTIIINIKHHC